MRNRDGVQRGSVMDMPTYPGDPLTPGVGATAWREAARHQGRDDAHEDPGAADLVRRRAAAARGAGRPGRAGGWRGALPITYRLGPGPARVHLKLAFDWRLKPRYNVIARLPGSTYPDEWIIRGNHHDAWVNGAQDPVSGMAAELEEARAFGELVKQGWRPKRTIVYAAWDGEEQGLLGSTEWVEEHEQELREKAAVYINTDGNGRGFLERRRLARARSGSSTTSRATSTIRRRRSLSGSACRREPSSTGAPGPRAEARSRADLRIGALGSGSDYSPFLQHAGIAVAQPVVRRAR